MKTRLALILSCLIVTGAYAQTTNVAPHQTFFDAVTGYFTAFNTNLDSTFGTHKGDLWSGARLNAGAHTGSLLALNYDFGKFGVESASGLADVSGTMDSQFIGVGYNVVVHDAKLSAFIGGSAMFPEGAATEYEASVVLEAKKALTEHTFTVIRLSQPIKRGRTPDFTVGVGFVF